MVTTLGCRELLSLSWVTMPFLFRSNAEQGTILLGVCSKDRKGMVISQTQPDNSPSVEECFSHIHPFNLKNKSQLANYRWLAHSHLSQFIKKTHPHYTLITLWKNRRALFLSGSIDWRRKAGLYIDGGQRQFIVGSPSWQHQQPCLDWNLYPTSHGPRALDIRLCGWVLWHIDMFFFSAVYMRFRILIWKFLL